MKGRFARGAVFGGVLLCAAVASAQAPHPIPPLVRPLRERTAQAELIVVARIVRLEAGRIEATAEDVLRGAAPARFEVKRSPLRPPPLAAGDRALLFLRGDRTPYVFSGDLPEVVPLGHASVPREIALRGALPDARSVQALAAFWVGRLEAHAPGDPVRELASAELSELCRVARAPTLEALLPANGEGKSLARLLVAVQVCGNASDAALPSGRADAGAAHATTPATRRIRAPERNATAN